jgi:hypothetical protein
MPFEDRLIAWVKDHPGCSAKDAIEGVAPEERVDHETWLAAWRYDRLRDLIRTGLVVIPGRKNPAAMIHLSDPLYVKDAGPQKRTRRSGSRKLIRADLRRVAEAMQQYPNDTDRQMAAVADLGLAKSTFYKRRRTIVNRRRKGVELQPPAVVSVSDLLQAESVSRQPTEVIPMAIQKTVCPITVDQFDKHATQATGAKLLSKLDWDVRGTNHPFSTKPGDRNPGKLGWNANGRITANIGGTNVKFQVSGP